MNSSKIAAGLILLFALGTGVRLSVRCRRIKAGYGHRAVMSPARQRHVIEDRGLRSIEDELFPMAELPDEWQVGDDGTAAPNWVAALHRSLIALIHAGRCYGFLA